MSTEKPVQKKIIEYLRRFAYVIKAIVSNRDGIPDLIICHKGLFIAFEIKDIKKKPTKLQEYNIQSIREKGGYAFSVQTFDEAKKHIEAIELERKPCELCQVYINNQRLNRDCIISEQ